MNHLFTTDWKKQKSCRVSHLIIFMLIVVFITGCATKAKLPPSEQTLLTRDLHPPAGKALLYFYYEKISLKPMRDGFVVQDLAKSYKNSTHGQKGNLLESVPEKPHIDIQGEYYALVVGIKEYQDFDSLPTAANDARAVARLLQDGYGFQVQTLIDQQATRKDILDALNAFRNTLEAKDKLLIYYAGRCSVDDETQTAYWLPVNAERDSDTQWILTDTITANIKRLQVNQILIVADSCYANALTRARHIDLEHETTRLRYLEKSLDTRSRILMLSGTTEPVVDSEDQEHSLFARAFLDALHTMDKETFTTEELFFGAIQESVAGSSEYLPELKAIRNSGHQGGDFIFQKTQAK